MVDLYRRIWTATGSAQIVLIVLSLSVAALAAVPLQFQMSIINGLSEETGRRELMMLCGGYLGILVFMSALKFVLQFRTATLSESVIQRIRGMIYQDRAATSVSDDAARGTLVTIIASEAEEVGRFAGQAIAMPLLQFGTLVSVIAFIAATQPFLGLFMVCIVTPQAIVVLTLQQAINRRIAERVKVLRHATGTITAQRISEAQQAVLDDFDAIYRIRRGSYRIKLSMKFALNVMTGMGTVGILLLGGLLFLDGRTDIGTVVASLSALTRINEPWRALIGFYRELSAVRVKFQLLLAV